MPRPPRPRTIEEGSVTTIITQKDVEYAVTVSDIHAWIFEKYHIFISPDGYACATLPKESRSSSVAKLVYGTPPEGFVIDHWDGNRLNNVQNNLRHLSRRDNAYNKPSPHRLHGYKGVEERRAASGDMVYDAVLLGTTMLRCPGHPSAEIAKGVRIKYFEEKKMSVALENETDPELDSEEEMEVEDAYRTWKEKKAAGWRVKRKYGNLGKTKSGGFKPSLDGEPLGSFGKHQQAEAEEAIDAAYAAKRIKVAEQIAAEDAKVIIPRDADGDAVLTAKHGEKVKVDDDIYLQLYRRKIWVTKQGYAKTGKGVMIHAIVRAKEAPSHVIDHDDHNKLNNKRANLFSRSPRRNSNNQKGWSNTGESGITEVMNGPYEGMFNASVQIQRNPVKRKQQYFKTLAEAIVWRDDIKRRRAAGEYGPYFFDD